MTKFRFTVALLIFMALAFIPASTVLAGSIFVDGIEVEFTGTVPVVVDGRTLVPGSELFEEWEFNRDEDTNTLTLTYGGYTIEITIGSETFYAFGETHTLDVPAQIINGIPMLPLRAIAEVLGYGVHWDNGTVHIKTMYGVIAILHINDSHGRIESGPGQFGFYQIAGLRGNLERAGATVLLFDSGDTFHGLPAANLRQGMDIAEIMDAVAFDAMVPGNHDFNYGYRRLMELAEAVSFPIIAANIIFDDTGYSVFYENIIIERGGMSFGVFGLANQKTPSRTHPRNVEGINFTSPLLAAQQQVEILQAAGVDYIILLSHLGIDPIYVYTADFIAAQVPGIDIILDGHSHVSIEHNIPTRDDIFLVPFENTVLASTSGHMREIGGVSIDAGHILSELITSDIDVTIDEAVRSFIAGLLEAQNEILSEVVGFTEEYLDGTRENVRTRQTNLGYLAASAILDVTNADVAFINGGSIRDSIPEGPVTRNDIVRTFPFGNYVVTMEVSGSAIIHALENSVASYPAEAGSFLQVAGITYEFDPQAEQRITGVFINGEPLIAEQMYIIATNDYISAGGGGFTMLLAYYVIGNFNTLEEILVEFFEIKMEVF